MKKRKLGQTDLDVSEICLGTMTWGEQNTKQDGYDQMDYALDMGINFFDTAEMYGKLEEEKQKKYMRMSQRESSMRVQEGGRLISLG